MSEQELQFKPLSEGLGFHPFSNGLPYAPAAPKRELSHGTGAVAAGRPGFLFPQQTAPVRVSTPIVKAAPAPTLAQALPAAEAPATQIFGWDYVGRRFFAFAIDSAIHVSLGAGILVASLWSSLEVFASTDALLSTMAFLLFFNWALIAAQEVAFGTSIGKKLFGLSLEGGAVALLIRALVFIPSALFLGAGILWCALDPEHRALHDIVTGIRPERN